MSYKRTITAACVSAALLLTSSCGLIKTTPKDHHAITHTFGAHITRTSNVIPEIEHIRGLEYTDDGNLIASIAPDISAKKPHISTAFLESKDNKYSLQEMSKFNVDQKYIEIAQDTIQARYGWGITQFIGGDPRTQSDDNPDKPIYRSNHIALISAGIGSYRFRTSLSSVKPKAIHGPLQGREGAWGTCALPAGPDAPTSKDDQPWTTATGSIVTSAGSSYLTLRDPNSLNTSHILPVTAIADDDHVTKETIGHAPSTPATQTDKPNSPDNLLIPPASTTEVVGLTELDCIDGANTAKISQESVFPIESKGTLIASIIDKSVVKAFVDDINNGNTKPDPISGSTHKEIAHIDGDIGLIDTSNGVVIGAVSLPRPPGVKKSTSPSSIAINPKNPYEWTVTYPGLKRLVTYNFEQN